MATKIKKTIILSATSRRRRAIALAGVILALVAIIGHLPQNWTNPIPKSAQQAAEAVIQKGERAQTGVSDSLSANNLAKQQQAARHAIDVTAKATSDSILGSDKLQNATRRCFKYSFILIPFIFLLWFIRRKKNKTTLGETILLSAVLVLLSAFSAKAATYAQYAEKYIVYSASCGWSDVCSSSKLLELSEDQLVVGVFIDSMYAQRQLPGETTPWSDENAEEHTHKVLSGQPFSAEEQEYYLLHSNKLAEGTRTLTARTARYFTAVRNSVINIFAYLAILFGVLSGLARLLAFPALASTWALPNKASRRKMTGLLIKALALSHAVFFASIAILVSFSWVSIMIPTLLDVLGIACWPISLMLIVPLCWTVYFGVVKFAQWAIKTIRPQKSLARVR